jgi:hypothetical protein
VNVALLLHMGTSEPVLFQRDGVQLHSPKSQPEDVLESLFQDVIDQDDAKLLRRLGKFLGPVLPSAKFRELTERDENDTLAEDLVHALSETDVTFVDVGAIDTAPMTTQESREIVIDESTLSDDDKAALRGELGWQETTEAGRSGVFARWGKGQFKLLHAGDDNYALFYEWDGGKWERIGCGAADELMKLAEARAESEIPRAAAHDINLEFARFFCGTPEQKAAAKERLEPVFQEVDTRTRRRGSRSRDHAGIARREKPPREADAGDDRRRGQPGAGRQDRRVAQVGPRGRGVIADDRLVESAEDLRGPRVSGRQAMVRRHRAAPRDRDRGASSNPCEAGIRSSRRVASFAARRSRRLRSRISAAFSINAWRPAVTRISAQLQRSPALRRTRPRVGDLAHRTRRQRRQARSAAVTNARRADVPVHAPRPPGDPMTAAAQVLDQILPRWRSVLPPEVPRPYFDRSSSAGAHAGS